MLGHVDPQEPEEYESISHFEWRVQKERADYLEAEVVRLEAEIVRLKKIIAEQV